MDKITADEAAQLIQDGDAILISGSGGGHAVPEALLAAVERRFLAEGKPRGLTSVSIVGVGDRAALGASHLAHEGLLKRAITSALVDSPGLVTLAAENKIEAYTLPQGALSQLMRDMAAGRPGLITKTGLNTFVDPRQQGARQSPRTPADFVEVINLAGEEWLLFKPVPVTVAFLRGTTVDEDGNVTMEEEAVLGEMLAMAQATRRAGGIVIVQVKRMAKRNTLHGKDVKIPGILVDFVVVDREQSQTYATYYDPSYSGELRIPNDDIPALPFGARKVIVRRAALELFPGAICNLGAGVSTGLSTIAAEEGLLDAAILTNEQGIIGGAPIMGRDSGGGQNFAAMIEQPAQFDFYDGGGLDLAFLSFAEVDAEGNVNVSRFGDKIIGVGGFINIAQNAKRVIFSGTLTAGDLDIAWDDGKTIIRKEGRHKKFVRKLEQVCYNASMGRQLGQVTLFVTERAAFRVGPKGLELIEIAPGLDVERDVISNMGFRPLVSRDLKTMDARIFRPGLMGLSADIHAKPRAYRSARVAQWHEVRAKALVTAIRIDGATRLYAIVGNPIVQVKSPEVFSELFASAGMNAVMIPMHVLPERFEDSMRALMGIANLDGLVATVPYKAQAVRFADRLGPTASRIGALNALRRELDGTWTGDMFDGAGFVCAFERKGEALRGRTVALFGAGGAGSAIGCELAAAGVASLSIIDPQRERAAALAMTLRRAFPTCRVDAVETTPSGVDMIVNASTVGMRDGDGLPGDIGPLAADTLVGDVVVSQEPTPLIRHAIRHGCRYVNGRDMLNGQSDALMSFFRRG